MPSPTTIWLLACCCCCCCGCTRAPPRRELLFARLPQLAEAQSFLSELWNGGQRNGSESLDDGCRDSNDDCKGWAAAGECVSNSAYMRSNCPRSCGACAKAAPPVVSSKGKVRPRRAGCEDAEGYDCAARAARGECYASRNATAMQCPVSCRLCRFSSLLREALSCEDSHANCASWASAGECTKNPPFMQTSCAASCNICDQKRQMCDRPPNTPPTVVAGTIDETMRRILQHFPQYSPRPLSQPSDGDRRGLRAPWVLTLQNFLNASEAAAFVSTCDSHFERSLAGDTLSPVWTSFQCWCSGNECEAHPLTQAVAARISDLLRTPMRYFEPFQVVRYEPGQFYRVHHDQNSGHFTPQGPRVYTFFM